MAENSLIADLREAVDKELALQQKSGRRNSIMTLRDGNRVSQNASGSSVYRFENFTGTPPEEGTKVEVSVGGESVTGRISGKDDRGFYLELMKDFGEAITEAKLTSDPLFLLKMQSSYLGTLDVSQESVKTALALLDESLSSPKIGFENWIENLEGLNEQQSHAVQAIRNQSNVFIWGPPGTGKTTTVGALVASAANSGLRVLVVSNTNTALDTAIQAAMPRVLPRILGNEGGVLRIGTILKQELKDAWGDAIDFEKVLGRVSEEIRIKLQKENETQSEILNRGRALSEIKKKWELLNSSKGELLKLESQEKELSADLEIQLDWRTGVKEEIQLLLKEIEENKSKGIFAKMKARSEYTIRQEIRSTNFKKDSVDKKIGELKLKIPTVQSSISKLRLELADVLREEKTLPNYELNEASLIAARSELEKCKERLKSLEAELSEARKELIAKASIVGCTAYRPLIDSDLAPVKFDLVVVDEASMIPLSLLFIAAVRSSARIVIAGDFRQLPPIISLGDESNGKVSERDKYLGALLAEDAFHKAGVVQRADAGESVPELVALVEQYRMRSELSELISDRFYPDHRLVTMNDQRDLTTPWGNETFITFDTDLLEPESSSVDKSRRNVVHAIAIERIVEELVAAGWTLDGSAPNSIGVISAFKEQARHTQRLLNARFGDIAKGASQTIHKFQGSERGLIIIDMTRVGTKSDPGYGRWQANPEPYSDTNLKWNVALSRARQHLIVVNHLPTMEQSTDSVISNILKEVQARGVTLDAQLLFVGDLSKKLPQKFSSVDPSILGIYKADDFYPAFENDLNKCSKSLILVSPFLTRPGVERWIPHLSRLQGLGIKMTVMSKPLDEGMNRELESELHTVLRNLGVDLKLEPGVHEKIAIVDGIITWHGSLNIMSHNAGTSEIMARFDSEDVAAEIYREIATPSRAPLRTNSKRVGVVDRSKANIQQLGDDCLRPGCGGKMSNLKENGTTREKFLSCSNYRNSDNYCGWTSNLK
jgi:superfamily I DNA and/or RNA helicase